MTAICGGGPSAAKPGMSNQVVMTAAAVEAGLTLLGLEPVALVLAPFIAGEVFDLTTFCTTDPPASVTLNPSDIVDVTNWTDPTVSIPALAKVKQWFNAWYWYQICECTSTSTPAAPTPNNPGAISISPGLPTAGANGNCWDINVTYTIPALSTFFPITTLIFPSSVTTTLPPFGALPARTGAQVPGTLLSLQATDTADALPATVGQAFGVNVLFWDGAFASKGSSGFGGAWLPSSTLVEAFSVTDPPSGTVWWEAYATNQDSIPHTVNMKFTFACPGQTSAPATPCCPPDPAIMTQLNAILSLLNGIWGALPSSPNSFAVAATHAGLTTSGEFALAAGTIALKITVTTPGTLIGQSAGDPITLFDGGWVTTSAAGGNYRQTRIDSSPRLVLVDLLADTAHYTLPVGAVVTIEELSAGP